MPVAPINIYGLISIMKLIFRKYFKRKCWPESNLQFSFKYFTNLWLIQKLSLKLLKVQTALVKEISRLEWVHKADKMMITHNSVVWHTVSFQCFCTCWLWTGAVFIKSQSEGRISSLRDERGCCSSGSEQRGSRRSLGFFTCRGTLMYLMSLHALASISGILTRRLIEPGLSDTAVTSPER